MSSATIDELQLAFTYDDLKDHDDVDPYLDKIGGKPVSLHHDVAFP
jgi:hypothetical protein